MRALYMRWVALGGLLAVLAGALWRQRGESVRLQAELELQRMERRELDQLRAEKQRLTALQIPAAELERLRADHDAVARLRHELDVLRQAGERRAAQFTPTRSAPPPSPTPSATEGIVADTLLKNVGRSTPAAAVETALWAATGGEVDALAGTLLLEGEARHAAESMLAGMPPAVRSQYGTPERLVALLTAKEIPLGSMHILAPPKPDPAGTRVVAQLRDHAGFIRAVALSVRKDGDGWKLVVPAGAIEKFRSSPAAPALAGK